VRAPDAPSEQTLPAVRIRIRDPSLRANVVQRLAQAGMLTLASDRTRSEGRHRRTVLVCDSSHLTRGGARGNSSLTVALVAATDDDEARRALAAGAAGIAFADELEALAPTVAAVATGQLTIPSSLRTAIAKPALTTREKQILALVVLGLSNREIADQLVVAESTVKSHLFSAFRRMGVRTRKEATALILDDKQGLGSGILAITR